MNKLKIFLTFFVSLMIQVAIIPNFNIFNSYPNMSLAFTIAMGINFGSYVAGYSGIIIGFIEDILFSQIVGIKSLIYYIIGFLVGYNEDSINKGDIRSGIIITVICTIFYWIMNTIIYMIIDNGNSVNIIKYLAGPIVLEIIFNIILYILCHYILKKVFKKRKFRF